MTRPGFLRRIAALLIDYALILGWMAIVAAVSAGIALATGGYANWLAWGVGVAELLGFVVLVLPVGIYLFVTESSARQATVGKRVLRHAGRRPRRLPRAGLAHPRAHRSSSCCRGRSPTSSSGTRSRRHPATACSRRG